MPLPVTFANLPTGNNPASLLDSEFAAVAAMGTTYCTATGGNAILLTPGPNQPSPTGYANGQRFNFIVSATNSGPVTIQVGGLAVLPLRNSGQPVAANTLIAGTICEVVVSGNGTSADLSAGFGVASGSYLPLGGGTLSGNLSIQPTGTSWAQLTMTKSAGGQACQIVGTTAGAPRWEILLGNTASEAGGAGSDFSIDRFNNAGTVADSPIVISRATGMMTVADGITLSNTVASGLRVIVGQTIGTNRWQMFLGDSTTEAGSQSGSNLAVTRFDDSGNPIDTVMQITRSTGIASFSHTIQPLSYSCRNGIAGTFSGQGFNIYWSSPNIQFWVDAANVGNLTYTSDYRSKRDVAALPSMWDRVKGLKPVSYKHKEWSIIKDDDVEHWGFVAHELQETLIEDAATGKKDEENLIQSPNLMTVVASLTRALQEAMARIEALEAR